MPLATAIKVADLRVDHGFQASISGDSFTFTTPGGTTHDPHIFD